MNPAVTTDPGKIEAAAAQWVVRRREGLDADQMREFMAWLAEPAHRASYESLGGLGEALARARATGASVGIVTELRARERRRRRVRRTVLSAAAVLALGAFFWAGPAFRPAASPVVAAPPAAEPLRRLPDGSIVELRPGAALEVRFDRTARRVELERGEALFRVEKDEARPFIVRAAGVDVRAVGTAFNVRLAPAVVEVLVTEGRVRVLDAVRGRSVLSEEAGSSATGEPVLASGEKCVVPLAPDGLPALPAVRVEPVSAEQARAALAWRIPRLDFDGEPLAAALARLNSYNRVQVRLTDPALGALRLSGTFSAEDPHSFARLAAATFGLRVTVRDDSEILLSRD